MITEAQRLERRNGIGSSDIGPILGLSPYATPYDVWLEKTGQLLDQPTSDPAEAGNRFEAGVLDDAEAKLGPLERSLNIRAINVGFPLASNLDARVIATKRPVEAKTAGLFGPLSADWDEDAIDGVPEVYLTQCQVHLLVTDSDVCHLPAFLGGKGFCMFEIRRNEELLKIILERCAAFWGHVRTKTPPPFTMPTYDVVKRIRRQPNKTISIPASLITDWMAAKEVAKAAEEAKEQAAANLLAAIGDAEAGASTVGGVTYLTTKRAGYTVEATEYRTLRFKKTLMTIGG